MKRLALMMPIALASMVGCGEPSPGTSVQISLIYDDGLGLDTADVTLSNRTQSGRIEHQLLLLVPDELAGTDMPIEVWARKGGRRAAYGSATTMPLRGETVSASLTLTACTPACQGDQLMACSEPEASCVLGCSEDGDPHCVAQRPSNGVDPAAAGELQGPTRIAADTTLDADTGEITGGLVRAPGRGNVDGIGYLQLPAVGGGGAPLAVFAFHDLSVEAAATVRVTGSRAVVLLVGDTARIAGTIDVSAGHGMRDVPGPGGGAGGTATTAALGCGPGGRGQAGTESSDGGGGGGGAGTRAGAGGDGGSLGDLGTGGVAGRACVLVPGEPLRGGSGGGAGSHIAGTTYAVGGGGGGALQITALVRLEVTGTIHAGGAGGGGGPAEDSEGKGAGAGGGGGSGGVILLEAPTVVVGSTAMLAANGGGGGGAGNVSRAGDPGEDAKPSRSLAAGGAGASTGTDGGEGGIEGLEPGFGGDASSNGGGGGGAVGAIVIRCRTCMVTGTSTPSPSELDVQL